MELNKEEVFATLAGSTSPSAYLDDMVDILFVGFMEFGNSDSVAVRKLSYGF